MNIPSLSNRLQACCRFIEPGDRVADVGCDHGYLGIRLLLDGVADSVIAADIRPMPLNSAIQNAQRCGVADRMTFHLSNGVESIPRDFDVLVCAGMGADTIISILDAAKWLQNKKYRLVIQCQSKRPELRKYLYENGYRIERETLAEDGKFLYPVMDIIYAPSSPLAESEYYISPALLKSKSPLLAAFYDRVISGLKTTVQGLSHTGGERHTHYTAILNALLKLEEQIHDDCF